MGMLVDTAEDGLRGLAMFQQNDYDVVMTDMSMPGMNGLQLTSEIKSLDPSASVVLISGWLGDDARLDASTDRPDGCLLKPLSSEQLTSVLIDMTQQ